MRPPWSDQSLGRTLFKPETGCSVRVLFHKNGILLFFICLPSCSLGEISKKKNPPVHNR